MESTLHSTNLRKAGDPWSGRLSARLPGGRSGNESRVRAGGLALAELATQKPDLSRVSQQSVQSSASDGPASAVLELAAELADDFGYRKCLEEFYDIEHELGRGGNGVVRVVRCKVTGREFACKSIPKQLPDSASEKKKEGHRAAVQREVEVLRKLRSCLNVAKLEDVFEDNQAVHIVMEYCKGGELIHAIGQRHYSERTVASYMRAVLRTLAQCHANHVLHRDIKPGNFMLLGDETRAPLKAIDFGLAVPYNPDDLPLDNLGLEGTPWFMAPEVLSSRVGPQADVWAAGVMAFQLLTGRFPFDDKRNPFNPSISAIWKSVLVDTADFNKSYWDGISSEAKEFVKMLLNKDPDKRPSAADALKHPWLKGSSTERLAGKHLGLAVVQRIQRFGSGSHFKRTVLEMIAAELLSSTAKTPEFKCDLDEQARALMADPYTSSLQYLYEKLHFENNGVIERDALEKGLKELGYRLDASEVERLHEQINMSHGSGYIAQTTFAASQLDWAAVQTNDRDRWLSIARSVFSVLDQNDDGFISGDEIIDCLRDKLPVSEVKAAVHHALEEAGTRAVASQGMDFESFMSMLKFSPSTSCLELYDDRLATPGSTLHGSARNGSSRNGRIFQTGPLDEGSSHRGMMLKAAV